MKSILLILLFFFFAPAPAHATELVAVPQGLPHTLQLGLTNGPNKALELKDSFNAGYRYQYLSGGLNTNKGWQTWQVNGRFVDSYIQESLDNEMVPVFSYYMIKQSLPGDRTNEIAGVHANLQNKQVMALFYADLKVFFQRAGQYKSPVVLQVEPDMWGYIEKRTPTNNAANYHVAVASSNMSDVKSYPNNAQGMAQAIKSLRDRYSPNVLLAYPISTWGTNVDISLANPTDTQVDALGKKAARYYQSLKTNFDLATSEFSDRDSAYKEIVDKQSTEAWWDDRDFANHARFLYQFTTLTKKRIILWQIPLGNTKMHAMDNTKGHYQDNRVETLLADPTRKYLKTYLNSGVIAFLFGGGVVNTTCACDAMKDGITNPNLLNFKLLLSFNSDDDGGYFKEQAKNYYKKGAMRLPNAAKPVPIYNGFMTKTTSTHKTYKAGSRIMLPTKVWSNKPKTVIVDIQVYNAKGKRVFQRYYERQAFKPNKPRTYSPVFTASENLTKGTYTVKVGIFTPKWGKLIKWNNKAFVFKLQ